MRSPPLWQQKQKMQRYIQRRGPLMFLTTHIGEKAIPGQVVDANSTANFGVGAFLLAACEMVRFLN